MIEVAIVGGGPAGSYCAYCLAENGIRPVIFDYSHPREKPCGGMISPLAQELFPFLKELPIEQVRRKKVLLFSPSGRKISINIKRGHVICVSRSEFDRFLLDMALNKGAELVREKVVDVRECVGFWKVKTDKRVYAAKKLVGADGVNSVVREKVTAPLKGVDRGVCYGYFVEGLENEDISLHFLTRSGYIWVIPRRKVSTVGIGLAEMSHSKMLKRELDIFVARHYPNIKIISQWAASIPNIKNVKTLYSPVAGKTWILIGDAAGHVNPVTGEGIPYALLSGELAAQAIAEDNLPLFEKLWRHSYGLNLLFGVKFKNWIYKRPILECYCRYIKVQSIVDL
jgi:geranylgeranyl reductase